MRILSVIVAVAVCIQSLPRAYGQAQPPPAGPAPEWIQIVTVHGENAINNVGQKSSRNPVIRVEDENAKPVAGASVVFSLPTEGASGAFGNGEKTFITTTDARGEAEAAGLRANTSPGKLLIHVNASYRGRSARASITQFNLAVPGKTAGGGSGKVAWILLVAAGAAGGGAAVALRSRNGAASAGQSRMPTAPIGIAPGTGTVGPPR